MDSTTESDKPSPLQEWLTAYHAKRAAIGQAVEELSRHLTHMPSPQSAEDVRALLSFRAQQFRLDDEPAGHAVRQSAAEQAAAKIMNNSEWKIKSAVEGMLSGIEMELTHAARQSQYGLCNLDAIDRRYIVVTGNCAMLTDRHGIPENHPLRDIQQHPRLQWLNLGRVGKIFNMAAGRETAVMPDWITVAAVERQANIDSIGAEAEARREAEAAKRHQEEQERERLRRMSREEILAERVEALEKQLAHREPQPT